MNPEKRVVYLPALVNVAKCQFNHCERSGRGGRSGCRGWKEEEQHTVDNLIGIFEDRSRGLFRAGRHGRNNQQNDGVDGYDVGILYVDVLRDAKLAENRAQVGVQLHVVNVATVLEVPER